MLIILTSDTPKDWGTPERIAQVFSGVAFAVHYSRNHMREKDCKSPRPKFHVYFYFPIFPTNSAQKYSELKKTYPATMPVLWQQGYRCRAYVLRHSEPAGGFFWWDYHHWNFPQQQHCTLRRWSFLMQSINSALPLNVWKNEKVIPQGMRNTTLFTFACRILVHSVDTDKARYIFWEKLKLCFPLLPYDEIISKILLQHCPQDPSPHSYDWIQQGVCIAYPPDSSMLAKRKY